MARGQCRPGWLRLAAALALPLLLSSCSVDQETPTINATVDYREQVVYPVTDPRVQDFIARTDRCMLGDFSVLEGLLRDFKSTMDEHGESPYLYQAIEPYHALEHCSRQAHALGNETLKEAVLMLPYHQVLISRGLYALGQERDGAFWLQRVVALLGQKLGLSVAGMVFIDDKRTLRIGARLLAEAARLGSPSAKSILLNRVHP
ncbi:MAG: hypothetical protein K6A65_09050 [Succinivibrionaceae bacterium]|nr:hypothetical protein [Succinivibrionaceae bacterium]